MKRDQQVGVRIVVRKEIQRAERERPAVKAAQARGGVRDLPAREPAKNPPEEQHAGAFEGPHRVSGVAQEPGTHCHVCPALLDLSDQRRKVVRIVLAIGIQGGGPVGAPRERMLEPRLQRRAVTEPQGMLQDDRPPFPGEAGRVIRRSVINDDDRHAGKRAGKAIQRLRKVRGLVPGRKDHPTAMCGHWVSIPDGSESARPVILSKTPEASSRRIFLVIQRATRAIRTIPSRSSTTRNPSRANASCMAHAGTGK